MRWTGLFGFAITLTLAGVWLGELIPKLANHQGITDAQPAVRPVPVPLIVARPGLVPSGLTPSGLTPSTPIAAAPAVTSSGVPAARPDTPPAGSKVRLPTVIVPQYERAVPETDPYVSGTLPNIIRPIERTKPAMMTGTGFFIATDGSVMTVAHVVKDCRTIQVASRHIHTSSAQLLASDTIHDLALLRVAQVRPPALLAFAPRPPGAARLDIFGYPGDGDNLIPTETVGTLRTDMPITKWQDAGDLLWMDVTEVRHGFSGGPVLGPAGDVVGLINGYVTQRATRGNVVSERKYTYGASTRMIDSFLQKEAPALRLDDGGRSGAGYNDKVQKAVVHVYCTL